MTTAERFYSELDALKLKAQEIPHTLSAEEVRACEAVKLQMKGELSAAGRVSVEEVEKIEELTKETVTVANGAKSDSGVVTVEKEVKSADTISGKTSAVKKTITAAKTETVVESANKSGRYYNGKYTGGRTQAELDDLARDPSHAFRIEEQGIKERQIGLELEERKKLGHIIRDIQENNGAEFIDTTTGVKWDVKSFESYPNGHTEPRKGAFTISNAMKRLNSEFNKNHNVIIDVRGLIPEHIDALKRAIEEAGVSDRIIWYS